ncbi:MAG: UDP-N-acetylmuramate dehydrogenase [Elusimicrobiota bacterium]|nr:UDP-N-acetylmuramate dehydrogenase [Elusimicrobiota bacterium]
MEIENIKELLLNSGMKIKFSEPLGKYTTLRIGGPARFYIEIYTMSQLRLLLSLVNDYKIPIFIIGAGSNLLISDKIFDGIVLRLKGEFAEITHNGGIFDSGAGSMLPLLVKRSIDEEYTGLEMLAGIPGTVGGAIVMNAGTHFGSISDVVSKVTTIDLSGKVTTLKKEEIKFGYRTSSLEGKIVLRAEFELKKSKKDKIISKVTKNMLHRAKTQPLGVYTAGSIFKNPSGKTAGELIEKAGLKNYSVGGAYISDKHANFIVNSGSATFFDVQQIISHVRKKVFEKFGIQLELEIKII